MQLPNTSPTRKPYDGQSRKLVIAFDIGTTYSGASYSILNPGQVPTFQGVTRFPGQAKVGDVKIPSIIYYDEEGTVRAVGSEANDPAFLEQAEDEEWIRVEWFKLHLRPDSVKIDFEIPPLPRNITPMTVFSDFLRYLLECTKTYIQQDSIGSEVWKSVEKNIDFILAHPNGWEGPQQAQMRNAATRAGLVSEEDSQSRVHFVTEGEASLHFCINKKIPFKKDEGVIILDAGGGTVDLSAYRQTSAGSFEEIVTSQCIGQGSVFVGRRAHEFLKKKLSGSRFGSDEDVQSIASIFDTTTKMTFRNAADPAFVKFGTFRDRDLSVDIKSGQLKLQGDDVKSFFEPSIQAIVEAVKVQRKESSVHIGAVFLVGGFSASDWLFLRLRDDLSPLGLAVSRPDTHVNKAVAEGALSFYLDHFVSVRVAKVTYGTDCVRAYNPLSIEHIRRSHVAIIQPSGRKAIPNAFSTILSKGVQVHEEKEFEECYFRESPNRMSFSNVSVDIIAYRGKTSYPEWMDVDSRAFSTLCTIYADVSDAVHSCRVPFGQLYYKATFSVVLLFGGPELKAQISWLEDGDEKRSPATIVYDQLNVER